jgi:hypothetical protein
VEALSGVEKKNINGRLTCLIKIFGSPLLPWPGKNIRLASFANAWQGFSANS